MIELWEESSEDIQPVIHSASRVYPEYSGRQYEAQPRAELWQASGGLRTLRATSSRRTS
jgi:hypothetical protein